MMHSRNIKKPYVAIASVNGIEVDLHLGQAWRFFIYGPGEDGLVCLLEERPAPEPGGGEERWQRASDVLDDCFALVVSGAGPKPKKFLEGQGLAVIIAGGPVSEVLDVLDGTVEKRRV